MMNINKDQLYDLAGRFVGLTLAAGGAWTLYDASRAVQPRDAATVLTVVAAAGECVAGLWLAVWNPSERVRSWGVAVFLGLWASSLAQAGLGRCSCGRFGSLAINPWYAVVFDLLAVVVLLRGESPAGWSVSPLGLAGRVLAAVLVAVAGVWTQPTVAVTGRAMLQGSPLANEQLILVNELFVRVNDRVQVVVTTDETGLFRLPPLRPGPYRVRLAGRPFLPKYTPELADLRERAKVDPEAKKELAKRVDARARPRRLVRQGEVEPVRPRGDSGILSWDAPACCGDVIPFHFSAADARRAQGW
jgi:hypothetical protein